jgi:anti-sigma factor RsiW
MNRPAEDDLHAYADGRLTGALRESVEDWLAQHPEDAAIVECWRKQNQDLHLLFDPVLAEAVPERLGKAALGGTRWRVAAAVAWVLTGAVVGYGFRGAGEQGQAAPSVVLIHSAALAHAVYSPEVRHPVEVGAEQEAHLSQWLSKRLGTPVLAPHLQSAGYSLLGGRLLPAESGAAAQFMYEDGAGKRITLYMRRGVKDGKETAFRYGSENGLSVFYWIDHQAGYALSGELPKEELLRIATLAYRDLEARSNK